jgi:hypothetical protein
MAYVSEYSEWFGILVKPNIQRTEAERRRFFSSDISKPPELQVPGFVYQYFAKDWRWKMTQTLTTYNLKDPPYVFRLRFQTGVVIHPVESEMCMFQHYCHCLAQRDPIPNQLLGGWMILRALGNYGPY